MVRNMYGIPWFCMTQEEYTISDKIMKNIRKNKSKSNVRSYPENWHNLNKYEKNKYIENNCWKPLD